MNDSNRTIRITESEIRDMVRESVIRIISEATINGHTYAVEKQLGKWKCIDGIYADYDSPNLERKVIAKMSVCIWIQLHPKMFRQRIAYSAEQITVNTSMQKLSWLRNLAPMRRNF